MKRYILHIIILLAYNGLMAQISTSPTLPTASNEVLVTFDAAQASNQSLLNYTGDLYAHTGVKIEGSTSWQYVKGSWGDNASQPKLTRTGTNTYTLLITPSIRSYYGVPESATITQLCFVFRSSDGSKQTEDIFCNVYADGLSVAIAYPTQIKPIFEPNSSIAIAAHSKNSTTLRLLIDNIEVQNTSQTSIAHNYSTTGYGKHWIKAIATDGTATAMDSVYILVRKPTVIESLPAGMRPGVNITSSSTATAVLHEPKALKTYAYIIGNFSNWLPDDHLQMKRTPDGKYFWLTLNNLSPNQEYAFQFLVDGYLRIADPYTNKTLDPHDEYIEATTYPNLMGYPKGKTTGIASVFGTQTSPYSWTATSYTPPAKEKLIIYELLIRDFNATSSIATAKDSISYLKKLGVNAIELMPFNEFEGNDSWGYNPSFYFAPDKYYGTPNSYKAFIDEAHANGMAVIMDIVLNHSYGQSPLVQLYSTSDGSSLGTPTPNNPWYNVTSPNTEYSWGYDFNHESPETKTFVDSVLTYWLTEYKVDGFRFDFTKGFTNTPGNGWSYDASRIAILKRIADKIWTVNPNAYVILEHLCDNSEEKVLADYGMLLWGNMNYNYNEATMGWLANSNFAAVSAQHRGWSKPHLVGYMESHDEERLMFKNITYGNSSNVWHDVKDLTIGLKRVELAANFFIPIPGPKMIWQFGELGYDYSIDYNGRVGRKPICWQYYEAGNRRGVFNTFAHLNKLKQKYDVFSTSNYTYSLAGKQKWIKLHGTDMDAVIIGNFDVVASNAFGVEFPAAGKWYEYYSQDSITLTQPSTTFNLAPAEYRLYTSVKIKSNQIHTSIGNAQHNGSAPTLYPNPSNGNFNIKINGNEALSRIEIYSTSGQLVHSAQLQGNEHHIALPQQVHKGLYIYRIAGSSSTYTGKLVIK